MARIRDMFSNDDLVDAWESCRPSVAKAAKRLSAKIGCTVSPQLMRYHLSLLDQSELPEAPDRLQELQRSRNAMASNNKVRKDLRAALDSLEYYQNLEVSLKQLVSKVRRYKPTEPRMHQSNSGTPMTIEALFSDLQIGKLSPTYNSSIARNRVKEYTRALLCKIECHQKAGYNVEKIVLSLIGDIIESDKKHVNSARGCDLGTGEQMKEAMEVIAFELIFPLALLGIEIDVICVTGNHDHDGRGMNSYMPGQEHLSWPLYHALKFISEQSFSNVNFVIPRGCFHLYQIYGANVLYEHGVGVGASSASMEKRRDQRAQQLGKHISLFRMGDKHHICRFNDDGLVVNGAFFGTDQEGGEYSSGAGYMNRPSQLILCHVPRAAGDPRSTIYDSFTIQLAHIKE